MKSKISATRTMQAMRVSTSGHLQDDPFDHVRHVLAAVGDDLHRLVNLLPLDDLDGIARRLEHGGQAVAEEIVGAVLEAVHLHRGLLGSGGPPPPTTNWPLRGL